MTGWLILGGFLAYWFLLRKQTAAQLVTAIRGVISNGFSAINQAGLQTGVITDPGTHDSYPGAVIEPLGITSAEPGSRQSLFDSSVPVAALPSTLGTVKAPTGSATVAVGALAAPTRYVTGQLAASNPLSMEIAGEIVIAKSKTAKQAVMLHQQLSYATALSDAQAQQETLAWARSYGLVV